MYSKYLTEIPKMSDCSHRGSRVIVRVDLNSPMKDGRIIDDFRIRAHATTVKKLSEAGARVVVIAHQGRPGEPDFSSLEEHAERLSKYAGIPVKFVPDVYGDLAKRAISELGDGEILLLDNVRKVPEEMVEAEPEVHADAPHVKALSQLADYFIFDGFGAAHRSHASIVGFPIRLRSCIGLVMEEELRNLNEVLENGMGRFVVVVGGGKVKDTLKAVKALLESGHVGMVLAGGLPGYALALADMGARDSTIQKVAEALDLASEIIARFRSKIMYAEDHVFSDGTIGPTDPHKRPMDIGPKTVEKFREVIREASHVIFSGPLGVIEQEEYAKGTIELLRAAVGRFVVVSGGHTIAVAEASGLINSVKVSTGGRSLLNALASDDIPALKALMKSVHLYWRK